MTGLSHICGSHGVECVFCEDFVCKLPGLVGLQELAMSDSLEVVLTALVVLYTTTIQVSQRYVSESIGK